jgi:hypothetical protein
MKDNFLVGGQCMSRANKQAKEKEAFTHFIIEILEAAAAAAQAAAARVVRTRGTAALPLRAAIFSSFSLRFSSCFQGKYTPESPSINVFISARMRAMSGIAKENSGLSVMSS